jgi:hypothetical protein
VKSDQQPLDIRLIQALWWGHGSLDGQATNVLPALLEEGDEVVDGQHDVGDQLVLGHADVADGDTHAENLLKLELDGGLDLGDLALEILVVGDWGWELASCGCLSVRFWGLRGGLRGRHTLGETWTQETWDLLDQGVGSDESIVLASELLDQLLVLVELLQVIGGHGVNTTVLGTIDIVLVTENAMYPSDSMSHIISSMEAPRLRGAVFDIPDAHVWAGNLGETDGSRETLVTLRIIVLEADLQLDGLEEVALLGLEGVVQELLDVGAHSGCTKI